MKIFISWPWDWSPQKAEETLFWALAITAFCLMVSLPFVFYFREKSCVKNVQALDMDYKEAKVFMRHKSYACEDLCESKPLQREFWVWYKGEK